MAKNTAVQSVVSSLMTLDRKVDFEEFLNKVGIIRPDKVSKFFLQIGHRIPPVLLDRILIESFGYDGNLIKQKELVVDLLKKNYSKSDGWNEYSLSAYKEYYKSASELEKTILFDPSETKSRGAKLKFYVLKYRIYIDLLFWANTVDSIKNRNYLLDAEDLRGKYIDYCGSYEIKQKEDEYKQIDEYYKQKEAKQNQIISQYKERISHLKKHAQYLRCKLDQLTNTK
jgi:hypothetical protein